MKILILGNSHSNDTFFQLARVFCAQGYEEDFTLGFLYHSGCSISRHVEYATENAPEYDFYLSCGNWYECTHEATLKDAVTAQPWDVVFLQAGKADLDDTLNLEKRRELEAYVNAHLPNEHRFAWHTSWPSPNDEYFFSDECIRKAPSGYRDNLERLYGFDPVRQFTVLTDCAKKNILPDDTYAYAICTGAGIMYANRVLNVSQRAIYRDYTHLSDLGRLIAAYSFYAQLTGKAPEEIKVDVIPAHHRQRYFQADGDLVVTEEMKEIILSSAKHALADPWTVL